MSIEHLKGLQKDFDKKAPAFLESDLRWRRMTMDCENERAALSGQFGLVKHQLQGSLDRPGAKGFGAGGRTAVLPIKL